MEELTGKFYDLVTKKEILRQKIEPYKIYLYIEDDYCGSARMVTFDAKGIMIDSTYVSYKEKLSMLEEVVKAKYINLGNTNVEVEFEDMFNFNRLQIRMPHIMVTYTNDEGEIVQEMLNENTMENMMYMDEQGNITINANNSYIGNDDYMSKSEIREDYRTSRREEKVNHTLFSEDVKSPSQFELNFKDNDFGNFDIEKFINVSQMSNYKISIEQFGFTGKYDLGNPQDVERFKKDIVSMPKNEKEAQQREKAKKEKEQEDMLGEDRI
ncbi:MAG: hypothetical protein HFJ26_06140 [Clostridia bacterium]|nr:hypothetical protein [Clostridia bacterium]